MKRTLSGLAFLVLAWPPLAAGEGRVPVYGPTAIVDPGTYVVTRDFSVSDQTAISISTPDVTLDLGGHTISSSTTDWPVIGVGVGPTTSGSVRIMNGRLIGGGRGIALTAYAGNSKIFIEGIEIRNPDTIGIDLTGPPVHFEVTKCQIVSPGQRGINVAGQGAGSGRIVDNVITGSPSSFALGIGLFGISDGAVVGNRIELTNSLDAVGIGFYSTMGTHSGGNVIERNRITHDGRSGLVLLTDVGRNLVVENIIRYQGESASSGSGIVAESPGNFLLRNQVSGHAHGISVAYSHNHLEANKAQGNEYGLYFSSGSDNSYRDNVLTGNTTAAVGGDVGDQIDGGGNIP